MNFKGVTAAILVAGFAAAGVYAAVPAMAETVSYKSWTESDDPAPGTMKDALVMFKAASINFGREDGSAVEALADVDGLAYTVGTSTGYAPSFQIGVVNTVTKVTYARLVWEPYMQTTPEGPNAGQFAGLENGKWWAANVWQDGKKTTPFGSAEGSQSKPQPLEFFTSYFGPDAKLAFFGFKQGTTTDSTSTVTSLTFEGQKVALNAAVVDATPFDSKDVAAEVEKATTPLTAEIAELNDQIAELKAALADAQKAASTTASDRDLAKANDAAAAKANVVTIFGPKKVGKTVTAKAGFISGSSHTYQWSVAGKSVKGATNSSFKLPRSSANDSLSVTIKTTWMDARKIAHSVIATTTSTRVAYVSR